MPRPIFQKSRGPFDSIWKHRERLPPAAGKNIPGESRQYPRPGTSPRCPSGPKPYSPNCCQSCGFLGPGARRFPGRNPACPRRTPPGYAVLPTPQTAGGLLHFGAHGARTSHFSQGKPVSFFRFITCASPRWVTPPSRSAAAVRRSPQKDFVTAVTMIPHFAHISSAWLVFSRRMSRSMHRRGYTPAFFIFSTPKRLGQAKRTWISGRWPARGE